MTAFATVYTPLDPGNAVELANNLWRKRVLPVGQIEYQGRTLHFTPAYLRGLANAFKSRAYDQVAFQLADSANTHTNDPERFRGTITDMTVESDGLYVTLDPTPRGEAILRENPYLGCSARIVEQFQRGDGAYFPAAVQHVLGTLDPRIPALGPWQPVNLSNESGIVIDLSGSSWAGEPGSLTDVELNQLLEVLAEVDAGDYGADPGELSDAEFEQMMAAAEAEAGYHDSVEQFDTAFSQRAAAEQAREQARLEFAEMDLIRPAKRAEDRVARVLAKAEAGLYSGQQMSFASEQAAIELVMGTGASICGNPDEFGRCAARYHALGCVAGISTDWAASPHPETGAASLSNLADRLDLDLTPRSVWSDPDDPDDTPRPVPQHVVELAHELAVDWGLLDGSPGTSAAAADLMRMPAAPVTAYDVMYDDLTYADPAPQPPLSRPGIRELAERMGLRR